jgi:hypothetical protein
MIAAGVSIGGLKAGEEEKKRVVYDNKNKKKGSRKNPEEAKVATHSPTHIF